MRALTHLLRREPLIPFVLAAAGIYALWVALAPTPRPVVRVDAAALRALEQGQVELLGRPMTEEERAALREGFVDDEVLLREALRRGLQFGDYRTRKRLLQVMRGALTERFPEPSVAELEAWFRERVDDYTKAESTTLEQVPFPWGEDVGVDEVERTLAALRAGGEPETFGADTPGFRRRQVRATRATLVGTFGAGFADRVEELEPGAWGGPVESIHGVHLVRVEARHPPEVPRFDDLESYLRQDWGLQRARELQQARVDEIRARYRVEWSGE